MFDFFDTSKLLIIGAVALMVIPPKDLPSVLRQLGQAVGKLRRMAAEFQGQFSEALKDAEFDSLKKELHDLQSSTNMPLDLGMNSISNPEMTAAASAEPQTVSSLPDDVAAPHPTAPIAEQPVVAQVVKPKVTRKRVKAEAESLSEPAAVKPKASRKAATKSAAVSANPNKDSETNV